MQAGKTIKAQELTNQFDESHKYPCFGGNGLRGYIAKRSHTGTHCIIGRQGALCGNVKIASGDFYATEHAVVVDSWANIDVYWSYYFLTALNLNQYSTATAQPGLAVSNIVETIIPLPPLNEQKRIADKIEELFCIIDILESNQNDLGSLVKQAKTKILDLAIRGKLVPQDPNDEPASELLKRINPKFSASCDNPHYENTPFETPDGWCWYIGKEIFLPMKSVPPTGETFKYIDIDSIDNKNHCIKSPKILLVKNAPSRASRHTCEGDVLFSMVRPYLQNIALVNENDCIASTGFYVCKPTEILHSKYLFYMMCSNYVTDGLNKFMKGDNSPSINKGNIDSYLFPIPPLNEQKRIVAKIEQLFSALDTITTL